MSTEKATAADGRGFSLIELMLAMCVVLTLVSITVPSMSAILRNYRRDAAVQNIVGDVRKSRSEAIQSGWQYRVVGYNGGASSGLKNQYRVMARRSSAVAWPSVTIASFESSTQLARDWVDLPQMYPGLTINPGDSNTNFSVAFDARGVRTTADYTSFGPLVISYGTGSTSSSKSVTVSVVGGIKFQ